MKPNSHIIHRDGSTEAQHAGNISYIIDNRKTAPLNRKKILEGHFI